MLDPAASVDSVSAPEPPRQLPFPPVLGGLLLGLGLYYGPVVNGLQRFLSPENALARMLSDPINVFSFMAFSVAMLLLLERWLQMRYEVSAFRLDLLPADEQHLILPDDARACRRRLQQLPPAQRACLLVQLLGAALQRARANWSAQDAGDAVKVQTELLQIRSDTHYAPLRYLAWAIPTIGFVSTLHGLAGALKTMKEVMAPRPVPESAVGTPVVPNVGDALSHLFTAFDTTFVALVLTLVLMLVFYRMQAVEDKLLVRAANWCLHRFVFRMHVSKEGLA